MTTVTVSNAFMNTDLSGIRVGQSLSDAFFTIYEETISWFGEDAPISSGYTISGNKFTYTNPIFDGTYGTYTSTGTFSGTVDSNNDVTSVAINLTARTTDNYEYGDGVITLTGSIKGSVKNNIETHDAFVKFFNVCALEYMLNDCVLGLFAVKCKHLNPFLSPYLTLLFL